MGVQRTQNGYRAYFVKNRRMVHVGYFPLGTAKAKIEAAIVAARERSVSSGQLGPDVKRFLEASPTRYFDIMPWVHAFGETRVRHSIERVDVMAQVRKWLEAGVSPTTVNKRKGALRRLWTVLDGPDAAHPCAGIKKLREPAARERGIDYLVIRDIFKLMAPSKSKARLQVIAYAGVPHATLKRMTADDIDWKHGSVRLPGRKKGAGTDSRTVPVARRGMAAFRYMRRMEAWGPFASVGLRQVFHVAIEKLRRNNPNVPLPPDPTPYDLRHSFATAIYAATGNLQATAGLMGHSSAKTTLRYVGKALLPAEIEAISATGKAVWSKRACHQLANPDETGQ